MPKPVVNAALLSRAQQTLAHRSGFDLVAKLPMARAPGRPDKSWYSFVNAKEDEVDILIYDEIGYWGTSAANFVRDLAEVDAKTVNLHINSPGGSVFDGIAIYNALVQHSANIIVHIDGWAASIASVIAMAGDEIKISEVARVMIHCPWSWVMGNAEDMRKEADLLDSLEASILDVYEARTDGERNQLKKWMKAETWFTGKEAVDEGFADSVVPLKVANPDQNDAATGQPAARLPIEFFAAIFPNLPKDLHTALAARKLRPADAIKTERQFEDFLRECGGFNGRRAKAIADNGFKTAADRPGGAAEAERPGGAAPSTAPSGSDRPGDAEKRAAAVKGLMAFAESLKS